MAHRNDDYRRDLRDRDDVRGWNTRGAYRESDDDRDRDQRRHRGYGGWDPGQYGYGERDGDRDPSRFDWRSDDRDERRRWPDDRREPPDERYGRGHPRAGRYSGPGDPRDHAGCGSRSALATIPLRLDLHGQLEQWSGSVLSSEF